MFKYEDYWPFLFGLFGLGGLLAVPLIWSHFAALSYSACLPGSLLGCGVFAYSHTRYGEFKTGRFLIAAGVAFLFAIRIAMQGRQAILPGGLLGFLVMAACGWAGIALGRATGISSRLGQVPKAGDCLEPVSLDERASKLVEAASRPRLTRFLALSHIAWSGGHLDHLSSAFRAEARGSELTSFIMANTYGHARLFGAVDQKEPFEAEEYLVSWTDAFVLTNRRLCLFTEHEPAGPVEIFALKDIAAYEAKSGWSKFTVRLTLEDGRAAIFPGLKSAPQERFVTALSKAGKAARRCDTGEEKVE